MEDEDEYSWPRRMIPRRHSMEDNHHRTSRRSSDRLINRNEDDPTINRGDQVLDFRDVFGGPPRSATPFVRSSGDFGITTSSSSTSTRSTNALYDGIFCHTTHSDRGAGRRREGIFHVDSRRMRSSNNSMGRNLPGFNIPSSSSSPSSSVSIPTMPESRPSSSYALKKAGLITEEGFYDDIFGSEHGNFRRRDGKPRFCHSCKTKLISKSKSKMPNSSAASILSSEDIRIHSDLHSNINDDTLPVAVADYHNNLAENEDVGLSSFTSKLRPITIPTRTTYYESSSPPSTISGSDGDSSGGHGWTPKINQEPSSLIDLPLSPEITRSYINTDSLQQYNCTKPSCGDHGQCQHFVNESSHISKGSSTAVFPTSVAFSVFREPLLATNAHVENAIIEKAVVLQEGEGNKAGGESSFIIEIDSNSHHVKSTGETEGAAALDEAIAWAKEKFWNQQMASDTAR